MALLRSAILPMAASNLLEILPTLIVQDLQFLERSEIYSIAALPLVCSILSVGFVLSFSMKAVEDCCGQALIK